MRNAYSTTERTLLHIQLIVWNHFSLLKQKKGAAEAAALKGFKTNSSLQAPEQLRADISNDPALLGIVAGSSIFFLQSVLLSQQTLQTAVFLNSNQ